MMKEAKRSTVSGSAPQPIKSTPARAQSVDLLRLFRDQPRKEAGEARQALRHLADRHMHPLAVDGVPCRARDVVDGGDFKAAGRQAAARRFVAVGAYLVEQRRVDEARHQRPHLDARSEARRAGKELVRPVRSRWWPVY